MSADREHAEVVWVKQEPGVYSHAELGTIFVRQNRWHWQRPYVDAPFAGWPKLIENFRTLREAKEFANEEIAV